MSRLNAGLLKKNSEFEGAPSIEPVTSRPGCVSLPCISNSLLPGLTLLYSLRTLSLLTHSVSLEPKAGSCFHVFIVILEIILIVHSSSPSHHLGIEFSIFRLADDRLLVISCRVIKLDLIVLNWIADWLANFTSHCCIHGNAFPSLPGWSSVNAITFCTADRYTRFRQIK